MAEFIVGRTANDVWRKAASMLLQQKDTIEGRMGDVFEILHSFITIEEPRQKWIYDRVPPVSIAYALAELVWIMNGQDCSDVINFFNPQLESLQEEQNFIMVPMEKEYVRITDLINWKKHTMRCKIFLKADR